MAHCFLFCGAFNSVAHGLLDAPLIVFLWRTLRGAPQNCYISVAHAGMRHRNIFLWRDICGAPPMRHRKAIWCATEWLICSSDSRAYIRLSGASLEGILDSLSYYTPRAVIALTQEMEIARARATGSPNSSRSATVRCPPVIERSEAGRSGFM